MTMKYDSRSCTVTTTWEWTQTGTSTTTTRQSVTTSQRWIYTALYDTWAKDGSLSYTGTNFVETDPPPYPSGSTRDGGTTYTSGSGMADVTTTTTTYGWGEYSTSNNASSSISYDDGTYAGNLTLDSVSGSPSSPSYSGSSVGQTAQTSTSGTAYYSGDVPLKDTGGTGNSPSTPTNFRITSQNDTSVNLAWDASSGATTYSVEVYNKGTTTNPVSQIYGITSTTKFITGLTTGNSYDIKLYAVNSYGNSFPSAWLYNVTLGSARPTPDWEWKTLSPTATTYTFGKLKVNLLTAKEWNDFCARVNEFRTYKGLPTITFTSASPSGDFTQAMYDEVYNAINAMFSVSSAVGFYTKLVNLSTALNNI